MAAETVVADTLSSLRHYINVLLGTHILKCKPKANFWWGKHSHFGVTMFIHWVTINDVELRKPISHIYNAWAYFHCPSNDRELKLFQKQNWNFIWLRLNHKFNRHFCNAWNDFEKLDVCPTLQIDEEILLWLKRRKPQLCIKMANDGVSLLFDGFQNVTLADLKWAIIYSNWLLI